METRKQSKKNPLAAKRILLCLAITSLFFFTSCSFLSYGYLQPDFMVADVSGNKNAAKEIIDSMIHSPDETIQRLGRALARLPDFQDSVSDAEVKGLRQLKGLAFDADDKQKKYLSAILKKRRGKYSYNASIQAMLWMAKAGELNLESLSAKPLDYAVKWAWSKLPEFMSTPDELLDFLANSFSYVIDRYRVQGKFAFFNSKYGDCSEFSNLAGSLLKKLGFEVYILLSEPNRFYGHVSVIFKNEVGYYLMDSSRAALVRILTKRREAGFLNLQDQVVWAEVKDFNRIFGPVDDLQDLVRLYGGNGTTLVPYRIIPFEEFDRHIEKYGYESGRWWDLGN